MNTSISTIVPERVVSLLVVLVGVISSKLYDVLSDCWKKSHLPKCPTPPVPGGNIQTLDGLSQKGCLTSECRETPTQLIVTFDQPLYTIAKPIQLKWPEMYGEDKFFVMFGSLHIKMAALSTLGDWLQSSGWAEALVQQPTHCVHYMLLPPDVPTK